LQGYGFTLVTSELTAKTTKTPAFSIAGVCTPAIWITGAATILTPPAEIFASAVMKITGGAMNSAGGFTD
jgi:hypothetical protein